MGTANNLFCLSDLLSDLISKSNEPSNEEVLTQLNSDYYQKAYGKAIAGVEAELNSKGSLLSAVESQYQIFVNQLVDIINKNYGKRFSDINVIISYDTSKITNASVVSSSSSSSSDNYVLIINYAMIQSICIFARMLHAPCLLRNKVSNTELGALIKLLSLDFFDGIYAKDIYSHRERTRDFLSKLDANDNYNILEAIGSIILFIVCHELAHLWLSCEQESSTELEADAVALFWINDMVEEKTVPLYYGTEIFINPLLYLSDIFLYLKTVEYVRLNPDYEFEEFTENDREKVFENRLHLMLSKNYKHRSLILNRYTSLLNQAKKNNYFEKSTFMFFFSLLEKLVVLEGAENYLMHLKIMCADVANGIKGGTLVNRTVLLASILIRESDKSE